MEMERVKNKKRGKKGIVIRTKEEKRKIRREKDKERKKKKKKIKPDTENIFDFDNAKFSDRVKFNEVVHAPPENLGKTGSYTDRKPGQQPNLLLTKMLNKGRAKDKSKTTSPKHSSISLARKCMLEEERKRVIEQYRKSKNKRNT